GRGGAAAKAWVSTALTAELVRDELPGKKMPFSSCPVSAKWLVEVLTGFEANEKPFALLPDHVTVACVSAYSPAKWLVASFSKTWPVTLPVQTTSKETVASTEGPSLSALPRLK